MDIHKSKYILPNLFTLASVYFGVLAITASLEGTQDAFRRAAIAILVAMVADSLDGRVARMTRTATKFGIQLDSLADLVSFGVAPAVVAHSFALNAAQGVLGYGAVLLTFVWIASGALRLARFNVLAERQRKPSRYFAGLPIPAAAGVLAMFVWVCVDLDLAPGLRLLGVAVSMPILSILMVSNLRYRNFKNVKPNTMTRLLMVAALAAVIWVAVQTRASAVLLVVGLTYVLMGPVEWLARLTFRSSRKDETLEEEE